LIERFSKDALSTRKPMEIDVICSNVALNNSLLAILPFDVGSAPRPLSDPLYNPVCVSGTASKNQELCRTSPVHEHDAVLSVHSKALISGRCDGKGGLSAQTVRHLHSVLKQALAQACVWRAITHNPADLVRPPKLDRGEMQTVNTDQTAAMIEAARRTPIFIPILLGVLCGMRRGEICALRWRSVDLDTGQLSVVASTEQGRGGMREKKPKSGKGRLVALPTMLVTELRRIECNRRNGC
jgi:integrase